MQIIQSGRGVGKTTKMITWLKKKKGRLLLVIDEREKNRLSDMYPDIATQVMSWDAYRLGKANGKRITECAVDNADIFIQRYFRHEVSLISLTTPQKKKSTVKK